jgi:hypothetical protein
MTDISLSTGHSQRVIGTRQEVAHLHPFLVIYAISRIRVKYFTYNDSYSREISYFYSLDNACVSGEMDVLQGDQDKRENLHIACELKDTIYSTIRID